MKQEIAALESGISRAGRAETKTSLCCARNAMANEWRRSDQGLCCAIGTVAVF